MKNLLKISTLLALSLINLNANLITEFDNSNCSYTQNRGVKTICKNLGIYLLEAESQTNINRYITLKYATLEINRLKLHDLDMSNLQENIEAEMQKKLSDELVKVDENHFMIVTYLHSSNGIEVQKRVVSKADLILSYENLAKRYNIRMVEDNEEIMTQDNNYIKTQTDTPKRKIYRVSGDKVNCRSFHIKKDNVLFELEKGEIVKPIMVHHKALIRDGFIYVEAKNDVCWVYRSLID